MARPKPHVRSETALRRALAEEGILEADEGRHTATIRADGELHRVLRLQREPWQRLWEAK